MNAEKTLTALSANNTRLTIKWGGDDGVALVRDKSNSLRQNPYTTNVASVVYGSHILFEGGRLYVYDDEVSLFNPVYISGPIVA